MIKRISSGLLELNLSSSCLDGFLQILSFFLAQTFLDSSGSTVNEILCFLESETTSFLNSLYNLKFGCAYFC